MGLFSGETKYYPFSSSFPLALPEAEPLSEVVLASVLGNTNFSNDLLNYSLNRLSLKVRQLKDYALNHYTLGLPSGTFSSIHMIEDSVVAAAIAEDITALDGVTIDFNMVTPLNLKYIALPFLLDSRGYNIYTNKITVFPDDMVLETTYNEYFERTNEVTVNTFAVNAAQTEITIEYKIASLYWQNVRQGPGEDRGFEYALESFELPDQFHTEVFSVSPGFHLGQLYCIAGYQINSLITEEGHELEGQIAPNGPVHWWYYDIASEGHDGFKDIETPDEDDYFYPVVPIRAGNLSLVREAVQDTDLYITSKKLMSKIGVDIDGVAASLEESPGIEDIDHAYIMFGVELKTEEQAQLQYLTEFFDYVADSAKIGIYDYIGTAIEGAEAIGVNTYSFNNKTLHSTPGVGTTTYTREVRTGRDTFETVSTTLVNNSFTPSLQEHGLDTKIGFTYIHSSIRVGSIGDGEIGTATVEKNLSLTESTFTGIVRSILWDRSTIIFRRQITATSYKEVTVRGLLHFDIIHQGAFRVVTPLSLVIEDPDNHSFLVPLHYKIVDRLPLFQQETLVRNSLVLLVNGVQEVDIPWYATGIWKFVFTAVAAFLLVWSAGQSTWLNTLGATYAGGGFYAVLGTILPKILMAVAMNVGLKMIAEAIGPEAMAILAIVAAAIAITVQFGPDSLLTHFGKLPDAKTFLSLSGGAMKAAEKAVISMIEDIAQEYDQFLLDSETKKEELERAAELLAPPDLLALNLLSVQTRYAPETQYDPSEFYDMKIHQGNVGTLALDVVPLYCDLTLKLPEFNGLTPEHMMSA
jgi:hypothetical protein